MNSMDVESGEDDLQDLATFAQGIAPEKRLIANHPALVARVVARLRGR